MVFELVDYTFVPGVLQPENHWHLRFGCSSAGRLGSCWLVLGSLRRCGLTFGIVGMTAPRLTTCRYTESGGECNTDRPSFIALDGISSAISYGWERDQPSSSAVCMFRIFARGRGRPFLMDDAADHGREPNPFVFHQIYNAYFACCCLLTQADRGASVLLR